MDYIYVVSRQQTEPTNPASGQIWIQIDDNENDVQAWIYIGNKWVPFAG